MTGQGWGTSPPEPKCKYERQGQEHSWHRENRQKSGPLPPPGFHSSSHCPHLPPTQSRPGFEVCLWPDKSISDMHRLYLTMKDWVQSVPSPKLSFMVDGSDVHTQALEKYPYLPWESRCYLQSIFGKYSLEHLLCVKQHHRTTNTKAAFLMVCKRLCPSTTNFFLFLLIQTCGEEEQGPGTPRPECAAPRHRREILPDSQ